MQNNLQITPYLKPIAIGIGLLTGALILNPFNSVPTGSRGVVTQFGRIAGIEDEGLVLLPPWKKLTLFSIRAEQADIQNAEGATSDTQPVHVSMTIRYSITPDKVAEVYEKYSHNGDLSSYVQTATAEVFKAITAHYSAPDLIAKRSAVSSDINDALKIKLAIFGANVISIDMKTFAFSPQYMSAIEAKVTQEQLAAAANNKLATVKAEQEQKVIQAKAEADAKEAEADGLAYSKVKQAQAEADALRAQGAALAANPQVLELRRIEVDLARANKWDGKLPENMYASTPIPFLNMNQK